jgi:nitroreductase
MGEYQVEFMDAVEAILNRRSIRNYTPEPISEEVIRDLLEAAMCAPSSKGSKPWHFIVINDRKTLNRIPLYFPYTYMIRRASVAIIVCGDESKSVHGIYWAFDCAAASENILIAAQAKGLGAVWCGAYLAETPQEVDFRAWLGIPENIVPFAIIPLGYPAESNSKSNRFDETRVHFSKW